MKTICLGTTQAPIWSGAERVGYHADAYIVVPSSDEQRHLTGIVRNIRRHAAWRLKKSALEYAKVHTAWTPRAIILCQGSIHGA